MSRIPRTALALAAILMTILLVWACGSGGGGGSSPTEPTGGKTVVVTISDDTYDPRSVTINPGDTVQWVLKAGSLTTHTVTDTGGKFDSGFVFTAAGMTFQRKFTDVNATYNYSCTTHKDCCNMKGSVRVGENSPPPDKGYQ